MNPIKTLLGSAALALAATLAPAASAQGVLKVGALNPYSGPLSLYGTEVTRGYELAADKLNASGGLLGRKIEIVRGDVTNPQQGIATVDQLANESKVDLFIGTYISAISLTASDAAQRYNKLYWETNAVAQSLTDRGLPNFIRSGPDGAAFANTSSAVVRDLVAPALKKDIKGLKVWIEHEDSIYGTQIAEAQKRILEAFGAKVVGMGAHSARSIDLNDTVLRAKQAAPDVLLQTGYVPDGNLLLRTARDQGFKPGAIVLVGTGDTPETLQAVGAKDLNGVIVVGYPRNDITQAYGPGNKAYLAAYQAKYKSDPVAPQGMAAYSGFMIMAQAVKAAGSVDADKVRAAAAKMDIPENTFPSGYGVRFDKNMQNQRAPFTASQWQGGKLVTVFPKLAVLPGVKLVPLARP
ncbi:MAG: ABC transporter substrate-binding protein [Burkholderiales bacterium]|nr:ABC transporter substrate-binding protein [Burkholderiales bacterium]